MMAERYADPAARSSSASGGMILLVIAVVATAGTLVSVAGAVSGVLAGHGWAWPSASTTPAVFAGIKALIGSPADPAQRWPSTSPAGPGWLVWLCLVVVVATTAWCMWKVWDLWDARRMRKEHRQQGLAGRGDLVAAGLTEDTAVDRARRTSPALAGIRVRDIDPGLAAIHVGRLRGTREAVYVQQRDCTLVEGPTGAGKTWRIATQRCWDAPGFLAATTTKVDLIAATVAERSQLGQIAVFDPTGMTGWPTPVRWSLLAGCEEPAVSIERAESMVRATPMAGVKNSSFWEIRASTIVRCYLTAAALERKRLGTVRNWVNLKEWKQPYDILHNVYPDWAADLKSITANRSESTDDVFGTASMLLDPLADPAIARMVDVPTHESIDLAEFVLGEANTIYLACQAEQRKVGPIVAAMTGEIYRILDRQSQREPGQRLAVPARLVLDEVNNIAPIPLPDKMTDSGGRGICIWAFVHNRLQNIKRWGSEAGQEFTINAPNRIVLPGLADATELHSLSQLFGTRPDPASARHGYTREVPVLTVDQIREMDEDQALMIYRGSRAIMLDLPSVWDNADLAGAVRSSMSLYSHICDTGDTAATLDDLPTARSPR